MGTLNHRCIASQRRETCRGSFASLRMTKPQTYLHARVQSPEILLGLGHIPSDLLFQRFDGRELDLVAQAIEEMEFDFGFRRKFERVKIQQVSFDGKRIGAKRRAVSNVGDRIETLVFMPLPIRVRVMYTPSLGTSSS